MARGCAAVCLFRVMRVNVLCFFFFNDTATTEIYTLSLHDALPIFSSVRRAASSTSLPANASRTRLRIRSSKLDALAGKEDRKSTRLNSSHQIISYAVFCLKKKITVSTYFSTNQMSMREYALAHGRI